MSFSYRSFVNFRLSSFAAGGNLKPSLNLEKSKIQKDLSSLGDELLGVIENICTA
jgi:hypothetical protein